MTRALINMRVNVPRLRRERRERRERGERYILVVAIIMICAVISAFTGIFLRREDSQTNGQTDRKAKRVLFAADDHTLFLSQVETSIGRCSGYTKDTIFKQFSNISDIKNGLCEGLSASLLLNGFEKELSNIKDFLSSNCSVDNGCEDGCHVYAKKIFDYHESQGDLLKKHEGLVQISVPHTRKGITELFNTIRPNTTVMVTNEWHAIAVHKVSKEGCIGLDPNVFSKGANATSCYTFIEGGLITNWHLTKIPFGKQFTLNVIANIKDQRQDRDIRKHDVFGDKLTEISSINEWKEAFEATIFKGNYKRIKRLLALFFNDTSLSIDKKQMVAEMDSLVYAAKWGHLDMIKLFLEKGFDINSKDSGGLFPLYMAAIINHTEIANQLIDAGANVNQQNPEGYFALFFAAYNNNKETAIIYLKSGADINLKTKDGRSALDVAYVSEEAGRLIAMTELIEKGYIEIIKGKVEKIKKGSFNKKGKTTKLSSEKYDYDEPIRKFNEAGSELISLLSNIIEARKIQVVILSNSLSLKKK